MTYKIFYENLHTIARPYMRDLYCTEMGVMSFDSEDEVLAFADRLYERGIACYAIDYKAEKGIGDLARHINQCYGNSQWSYERDKELVCQMYRYIKRHNFPCVFPIIK